jgi:uncharacterized protein YdaU (DUF1376 family)
VAAAFFDVMHTTPIWMPVYVGDYLGDTIGLSLSEHGAYFLSMMAYWRKGESLTARELRGICGKEIDRVSQFYTMESGRWHHKRIDIELEKSRKNMKNFQEKAAKMVQARRDAGQLPKKKK